VVRRLAQDVDVAPEVELVLYRVAQEALTNVARHADAAHVTVQLEHDADATLLVVSDDGRGLPPGAEQSSQGIRGMRERAMLVNGTLSLESNAGGGTVVRLSVPRAALR
jgi:two-component system sensor histidine kinase UhpB